MKFILLLSFFYSSLAFSKSELKIRKCLRANGSIDYQEKPCDIFKGESKNHFTNKQQSQTQTKTVKAKPKAQSRQSKTIKQKPVKIQYQKLSSVSTNGLSTQTISDRVKSNQISLLVLSRWSMIKRVYNDKLLHLRFLDETPQSELSLLIDFTDPQGKSFNSMELTDLSNLIGSRYAKGSREGRVNTRLFPIQQGKGVVATFTDSNLSGDYLFATKGLIYKQKWLIQFTLLSNDLKSSSYQFALNSLSQSISIQ